MLLNSIDILPYANKKSSPNTELAVQCYYFLSPNNEGTLQQRGMLLPREKLSTVSNFYSKMILKKTYLQFPKALYQIAYVYQFLFQFRFSACNVSFSLFSEFPAFSRVTNPLIFPDYPGLHDTDKNFNHIMFLRSLAFSAWHLTLKFFFDGQSGTQTHTKKKKTF